MLTWFPSRRVHIFEQKGERQGIPFFSFATMPIARVFSPWVACSWQSFVLIALDHGAGRVKHRFDALHHSDADFLTSAMKTFSNSSYEIRPELVKLTVRIICRISSSAISACEQGIRKNNDSVIKTYPYSRH
jgi:hypothetical protein